VYKPIIKSLLWHGADYNIKNKQGKTALYMDLNFKEFLQK
jgi:ankyrin repeat protein